MSGWLPPAPSGVRDLCSVCGHFHVSPEPAPAPPPGRTAPPAGLSAMPVTGTENAPASPSGSSGPAPEKESYITPLTTIWKTKLFTYCEWFINAYYSEDKKKKKKSAFTKRGHSRWWFYVNTKEICGKYCTEKWKLDALTFLYVKCSLKAVFTTDFKNIIQAINRHVHLVLMFY